MITDAIAAAGGTMGTPTMPPKGVIKARARARVGALCAMIHVATPSPKAAAAAQRAEQQSAKKDWMKDAMAKRVKNKKIADIAAKHGAHDADALDKLLASRLIERATGRCRAHLPAR